MRNLKRALSLALASVMLVGMMVVGTSAASFPDVDESKHDIEAIEVLKAVGVMNGDAGTGNFRPDDKVSRNEMAVVMARLILGNYAADSYVGSHPFTDVPSWADKYVAACYASGIINGTSATTYSGTNNVTAVQAAAMMLRALGYEDLSLNAPKWDTPVAAKANEINLFSGLTGSGTAQLTRNDIAKLSLNALEATMVTTEKGTDINIPGTVTVVTPRTYKDRETKTLDYTRDNGKYLANTSTDDKLQLCEYLYGTDLRLRPNQSDNYGQPGKNWTYKSSDPIATRVDSPILTYTDHEKATDVTKDLKNYKNPAAAIDIQVDGHDGASVSTIANIATQIDSLSGKGVTVNVYADSDSKITDVVVINAYIGQVTRVKTEDGETTVTVSKKAGGSQNDNTFETEAFAKDDYVLYTVGSDGIETMTAAEKVTGEITALSADYLRLDGDRHDFNKNKADASGYTPAAKDTADLYLDADGNVLYVAEVESAADEYLYVKGADKYFDTLSIRAVFSDGTTKIVSLSGETVVETDSGNEAIKADNTPITGTVKKLSDADEDVLTALTSTASIVGDVYAYEMDGDEVKLTSAATGTVKTSVTAESNGNIKYAIEKNNSTLFTSQKYTASWADDTANSGADVVANSNTVYVMVSDGKTYTGFRNVPSMDDVSLIYVVNDDNSKLVDLVFITASEDGADENSTYFYIKDKDKKETYDDYILWTEAYIDGEKTDVQTTKSMASTIDAPGLYKATKENDKGYFSAVTATKDTSVIISDGVQADVASNGSLKLDAANTNGDAGMNLKNWSYDSETLFVSIDKDGDVTANNDVPADIEKDASPATGDSQYFIYVAERKGSDGQDKSTAKVVYVVESVVPASIAADITAFTVTFTKNTTNGDATITSSTLHAAKDSGTPTNINATFGAITTGSLRAGDKIEVTARTVSAGASVSATAGENKITFTWASSNGGEWVGSGKIVVIPESGEGDKVTYNPGTCKSADAKLKTDAVTGTTVQSFTNNGSATAAVDAGGTGTITIVKPTGGTPAAGNTVTYAMVKNYSGATGTTTVTITYADDADGSGNAGWTITTNTITVTAEDGTTTQAYTVSFE